MYLKYSEKQVGRNDQLVFIHVQILNYFCTGGLCLHSTTGTRKLFAVRVVFQLHNMKM